MVIYAKQKKFIIQRMRALSAPPLNPNAIICKKHDDCDGRTEHGERDNGGRAARRTRRMGRPSVRRSLAALLLLLRGRRPDRPYVSAVRPADGAERSGRALSLGGRLRVGRGGEVSIEQTKSATTDATTRTAAATDRSLTRGYYHEGMGIDKWN